MHCKKLQKNQIRVQRFRDERINQKNDEFKFFVQFHEHLNFFDQNLIWPDPTTF